MNDLREIKVTPKIGQEVISNDGVETNYTLLDFWRWSVSDLVGNATRGQFAEFVVGTAIGLDPKNIRVEWDSYDLQTDDGIKIEVKSAAYIQTWNQRKFSNNFFLDQTCKVLGRRGGHLPWRTQKTRRCLCVLPFNASGSGDTRPAQDGTMGFLCSADPLARQLQAMSNLYHPELFAEIDHVGKIW